MLLLVFALTMPMFNRCKKGEGDPFLSLSSRKARIVGEWIIDKWIDEFSFTETDNGETDTGNSKTEVNGNNVSVEIDNINGNGTAKAELIFEKDGTFERILEYIDVFATVSGESYTTTFTEKFKQSGTWNFLGGIEEDYKNKERIILNILKTEHSYDRHDSDGFDLELNEEIEYANGENTEIWHITSLKNKEIIMEAQFNRTG